MTTLLDLLPMTEPHVGRGATPAQRAEAFHKANPQVFVELRRLALTLVDRGHQRFAIATLFEQLRWETYLRTTDTEGFKLNNSHRAFYSRLLMDSDERLANVFETRSTK
jgi:hypothetical protein